MECILNTVLNTFTSNNQTRHNVHFDSDLIWPIQVMIIKG